MSAPWVAGDVRAVAMARRIVGIAGVRRIADSACLSDALSLLATSPYSRDMGDVHDLTAAQRAVACTLLWNLRVLAGWALTVGAGWSIAWVFTWLGTIARSAQAVQGISMMVMFPLTFLSNAFVPTQTMPGWLQTFVKINPVSQVIYACRDLMNHGEFTAHVGWAVLGCVVSVAIFRVAAPSSASRLASGTSPLPGMPTNISPPSVCEMYSAPIRLHSARASANHVSPSRIQTSSYSGSSAMAASLNGAGPPI